MPPRVVGAMDMPTKNELGEADAVRLLPVRLRLHSPGTFDSGSTWPAMSEAVLGRVEWSQLDTNGTRGRVFERISRMPGQGDADNLLFRLSG